jgi:hypothetical protein
LRVLPVATVALVVAPSLASGHPSWSVVRDPRLGVVYYSDLTQVWKVDSMGRRTVAVPRVHTHELMLDADGNLFGEDLQATNGGKDWRHRVWKLGADGRLTDLIPWRSGFRDDYGFVRDREGSLYWASCDAAKDACVVKRRRPDGTIAAVGRAHRFARPLNFLATTPDGSVVIADGANLHRLTASDRLEPLATRIGSRRGRFALMGFEVTADGSIHLAGFEDRVVYRLEPGSRSAVVEARSPPGWAPTGVAWAPDGLWVLEYRGAESRLVHVSPTGRRRIAS